MAPLRWVLAHSFLLRSAAPSVKDEVPWLWFNEVVLVTVGRGILATSLWNRQLKPLLLSTALAACMRVRWQSFEKIASSWKVCFSGNLYHTNDVNISLPLKHCLINKPYLEPNEDNDTSQVKEASYLVCGIHTTVKECVMKEDGWRNTLCILQCLLEEPFWHACWGMLWQGWWVLMCYEQCLVSWPVSHSRGFTLPRWHLRSSLYLQWSSHTCCPQHLFWREEISTSGWLLWSCLLFYTYVNLHPPWVVYCSSSSKHRMRSDC